MTYTADERVADGTMASGGQISGRMPARRMIEITPGSAEWLAWLAHYRGGKTELRMMACMADGRSFYVWSRMPPAAADAQRVSVHPVPAVVVVNARAGMTRSVSDIADRIAARLARDAGEQAVAVKLRKGERKRDRAIDEALGAVREGRNPSLDALPADIGIVSVIDPDDEVVAAKGKTVARARVKLVALRDDPVGLMQRRKQLGEPDDAMLRIKAARHLQALYEAAEIGGARAIDPCKDVVSGGRVAEPDTDRRLAAIAAIGQVERVLGRGGAELVRKVLWQKLSIAQAASDGVAAVTAKRLEYVGQRFRECLDTVARELGYVATARGARRVRDGHDAAAGMAEGGAGVHRAARAAKRGGS